MASRSQCGHPTTRPSRCVIALSVTPSSTPAKIRNSVAAKGPGEQQQARENDDTDAADGDGPGEIVSSLAAIVG